MIRESNKNNLNVKSREFDDSSTQKVATKVLAPNFL